MNKLLMLTHLARIVPYRTVFIALFFTGSIHYIRLWLKKDLERNHLLGFCFYCALLCISFYTNIPALRFILLISTPGLIMFFIVLHVEMIFKGPQLSKTKELTALTDEIIHCAQIALAKRREVILVIEGNDTLRDLIHAPYFIYAEFRKDIFEILLSKQIAGTDYLIWINHHGKIVSINSDWKMPLEEAVMSEEITHMQVWKQHALYITNKSDALVLKFSPANQTIDVVSQGHILEGLRLDSLITNLKEQLRQTTQKDSNGLHHESHTPSVKVHREP